MISTKKLTEGEGEGVFYSFVFSPYILDFTPPITEVLA